MYNYFMQSGPQRDDFTSREYESLVHEGIALVKGGQRAVARKILLRAVDLSPLQADPWIWLSATTDDPKEQQEYLARAVGIDPSNAVARRGLAILTGKLDPASLRPEGSSVPAPDERNPDETTSQAYRCEKCGGSLVFSIQAQNLVCTSCRSVRPVAQVPAADQAEQALDPALMGERAHRWAKSRQRVTCAQCGSVILRGEGQQSDRCPYCASNRLVQSEQSEALIAPQVIGLMRVGEKTARQNAQAWLSKGWLAPEGLARTAARLPLAPAYYPFWTFDGTLQIPWQCEVNEGTSRSPRWMARSGEEFELFDDVLMPAVKAMPPGELAGLEPFPLKDLVAFSPDFLAGWTALLYDIPMAEASLKAREKVINKIRSSLYGRIEPGREKRNISNGAGRWSDMTYKQALLPLWVGVYTYKGKLYRLLVNGQTGKVSGSKPVDRVNLALLLALGVVVLLVALFALLRH